MNILAIDSCSNVATCAVVKDGVLVGEAVINDKKTHSVKLLPLIEGLLRDIDTDIWEIDYYGVTTGPGSFTGQRIGISTVKGLSHATNKKCVGVSTLEALSYNIFMTDFYVCPIMDARREQVYTATFKNGKYVVKDRAVALLDLLGEQKGKDTIFVGDGVKVFRDTIYDYMGSRAHFPPLNLEHLRGGSVAAAAQSQIELGNAVDGHLLLPVYLRKSQAEREYLEKTSCQTNCERKNFI